MDVKVSVFMRIACELSKTKTLMLKCVGRRVYGIMGLHFLFLTA